MALGLGAQLTEATTAHSDGGDPEWLPYGWLFWIGEIVGRQAFLAAGWAGQYVLVVPPAELTIVITGEPERMATPYGGQRLPVIRGLPPTHRGGCRRPPAAAHRPRRCRLGAVTESDQYRPAYQH